MQYWRCPPLRGHRHLGRLEDGALNLEGRCENIGRRNLSSFLRFSRPPEQRGGGPAGSACWAPNYIAAVFTLPMMRHANRVSHRDGSLFCPNSQSFHAVQIDSRVKHPCRSALLFNIPSMSSSRVSCLSHENRDRTPSTCIRSYHTNGTLSLRKPVRFSGQT